MKIFTNKMLNTVAAAIHAAAEQTAQLYQTNLCCMQKQATWKQRFR